LVKSKFGEVGIKLAEGTIVWLFPRKNSKNPFLTSADFIELIDNHTLTHLLPQAPRKTGVVPIKTKDPPCSLPLASSPPNRPSFPYDQPIPP